MEMCLESFSNGKIGRGDVYGLWLRFKLWLNFVEGIWFVVVGIFFVNF